LPKNRAGSDETAVDGSCAVELGRCKWERTSAAAPLPELNAGIQNEWCRVLNDCTRRNVDGKGSAGHQQVCINIAFQFAIKHGARTERALRQE